jgi:hypothetical protein
VAEDESPHHVDEVAPRIPPYAARSLDGRSGCAKAGAVPVSDPRVTPSEHNADMSASGALIAESLSKDNALDAVHLGVHRISRRDVGDVNAGQPLTWTFIEFEVDDEVVTDLTTALSRSIEPSGGWYCDFRTDEETFVVFAGQVFRYPRGEAEGRAEVEAFARSVGVPEVQLDWPE